MNMIDIKSKKIFIRKFKKKDIDIDYLNWFKNKDNFKYSRHKNQNYSIKKLVEYYKIHKSNKNSLFLVSFDKTRKKKIATLTIYINKKIKTADIGILIGEDGYKKKNLSKTILNSVFNYLFLEYKLKQITMGTHKKNQAMIKSCTKLGMKKQRIESRNNKEFVYFKKDKENTQFIGIICKDLGSAIQIYHYIKKLNKKIFLLFLEGPAKNFYKRNKTKKFIFLDNIDEIIMHSEYVISGTGTSHFEKKNMLKVLRSEVKVKAVIDHITNYEDRFKLKEIKIIPNEIIIFDEVVFNFIKRLKISNYNKIKVTKLPNYYLKSIIKKTLFIKRKKNYYLFIGEPFKRFNNKFSIDENGAKLVSRKFNKSKDSNIKLFIRLHPKQNLSDYKNYKLIIKKYCPKLNVILDKKDDLFSSIKQSKCVFGLTSYALLISVRLKSETFHCLNANSKIKPLPDKRIKNLKKFRLSK